MLTAVCPLQVPKLPKLLCPVYQLLYSADSSRLFVASDQGSVHVVQLLEPGGCKHLQTLRPPSGTSPCAHWWGAHPGHAIPLSPIPGAGSQFLSG